MMKIQNNRFKEELEIFRHCDELTPPLEVSSTLREFVRQDLNPSVWNVFMKVLGVHAGVSLLSLSICSQFGIRTFSQIDLMENMMRVVGHTYCMAFCGALYLGLSAIVLSALLKPQEIKLIRQHTILQMTVLTGISMGVFLCAGASVLVLPGILWLIGSVIGGAVGLELGWLIRSKFRNRPGIVHFAVFFLVVFCPAIWSSAVSAHPVSYQGATGIMTWNQPFMSDSWMTYSFRSDTAVAARFMRMEMPDGRANYTGAQLDYLLFRRNEVQSQTNLYVYGGAGSVQFQNSLGGAGFVGVEADAETRKYFGLIKTEYMRSSIAPEFSHVEARIGIAPYEAEYSEVASWLMLQAQWHPGLQKKFAVTPLIRLFYKSVLWESGVSTDGDWMMNFMFHF